jgi:hypothetical protein
MKNKTILKREGTVKTPAPKTEELKTEPPISEKDEVKQAEDKTIKSTRKHL